MSLTLVPTQHPDIPPGGQLSTAAEAGGIRGPRIALPVSHPQSTWEDSSRSLLEMEGPAGCSSSRL